MGWVSRLLWCCGCALVVSAAARAVEPEPTAAASEAPHDSHHPLAWSANQHGAFVDNVTHQRVVKHGDHYDKVLSRQQSSNLFLGILVAILASQIGLHWWKRKSFRSFQIVTLVGLWVLPFSWSVYVYAWKFLVLWLLFTLKTGQMIMLARGQAIEKDVPKRVYTYFYNMYRGTYGLACFGYISILCNIFGISFLLHINQLVATIGTLGMFYGLYFGVMARDCAELSAEFMASSIGFTRAQEKYYDPSRCAICAQEFKDPEASESHLCEMSITLGCGHVYHENCIRGWAMVGKKDTCPMCNEKVEMRAFSKTPWGIDGKGAMWGNILDAVRYLIVWNPVILGLLNGGMHYFGLH